MMTSRELKIARAVLGLTQAELAEILEIATNSISRYETGAQPIPKTVELAIEALENRLKPKS